MMVMIVQRIGKMKVVNSFFHQNSRSPSNVPVKTSVAPTTLLRKLVPTTAILYYFINQY